MAEQHLELDSEWRDRYRLFHLADGSVKDSRLISWRRVEWERVVKIELFMRGRIYTFTAANPGFLFFLNFKSVSFTKRMGKDGKLEEARGQRTSFVNGWADDKVAHLVEVDVRTCCVVREYTEPLDAIAAHIHPRCKSTLRM